MILKKYAVISSLDSYVLLTPQKSIPEKGS